MNVCIIYSYDGSKFYGMQRQKDKKTVQGEIEKILKEVFNEEVNMISSGRTDSNVHALAQVSNFTLNQNIPLEAIKKQINKKLYGEVKIDVIKEVDDDFNSRYSASSREYMYQFKHLKDISPFEAAYISAIKDNINLDVNEINDKLNLFIGTHNFTHYSKTDKDIKNPIRTIYKAECKYENDKFVININGGSFLKSMIRLIAASVIYDSKETIKKRLNQELNDKPKKILSPFGLYLKEVIYDNKKIDI